MYSLVLFVCLFLTHTSLSTSSEDLVPLEIEKIINNISNCHIHLIINKLEYLHPIHQNPITIHKLKKNSAWTVDAFYKMENAKNDSLVSFDVLKTKGLNCVFVLIYISEPKDSGFLNFSSPNETDYLNISEINETDSLKDYQLLAQASFLIPSHYLLKCTKICGSDDCGTTPKFIQIDPSDPTDFKKFKEIVTKLSLGEWIESRGAFSLVDFKSLNNYKHLNPFRPSNFNLTSDPDNDFSVFVLSVIFSESNSTLGKYYANYSTFLRPSIQLIWESNIALREIHSSIIMTTNYDYRFLTCYTEPRLSFHFYIQPFQMELWVVLIISMVIMGSLLHLFIVKYLKVTLPFSPYFFIISTLIEEAYPVPNVLMNSRHFRIVFGFWILVSVVFTNGYIGLAISGLSSPLPYKSPVEFEELTSPTCDPYSKCLKGIWSDTARGINHASKFEIPTGEMRPFDESKEFRLFSTPLFNGEYMTMFSPSHVFKFGQSLLSMAVNLYANDEDPFDNEKEAILFSLFNPVHSFAPKQSENYKNISMNSAIETELIECGRTAFVEHEEVIRLEYSYLTKNYPWIDFTVGKDGVLPGFDAWSFDSWEGQKVPEYFKTLISSGIYHKILKYFDSFKHQIRLNYTRELSKKLIPPPTKPMGLSGNIQTVFIICGLLVVISIFTILWEIVYFNWFMIRRTFRQLWNRVVAIFVKNVRKLNSRLSNLF